MFKLSAGVRPGLYGLAAVAFCAIAALPGVATAGSVASSVDPAQLPQHKRTRLGLYVTSRDAYAAVKAKPSILFLDVRSRAEVSFVGHPTVIDKNIPFRFLSPSYEFDPKRKQYKMQPNPDFAAQVMAAAQAKGVGRSDPIFLICRSGSRSRGAADVLAKLGFTQGYNVVDGFEGDRDKATGHRTVNGWKNAGLPWRYAVSPSVAYGASGGRAVAQQR